MLNKERLLLFLIWCFIIAAAVCLINGLFLPFSNELYHYPRTLVWLSFAGMLIIGKIVFERIQQRKDVSVRKSADRTERIVIVAMLLVHLLAGYWMEYTPSGDNFMLYQASQTLARDGAFEKGSDFLLYFGRYSNQWGFLLLLTGIYRLLFLVGIQNTFYPLVVLQAVLYAAAFKSMFRIVAHFSGNRGRLLFGLTLVTCFPLYLAASVLYTDTFSMPFVIFTLEAAVRVGTAEEMKKKAVWALLCGTMAFLGGQIKMTVLIVLIAASICWLCTHTLRRAVLLIGVAGAVVGIGGGIVHATMLSSVLDRDIYRQEHTPVIHWIMMSIPSADNPYGGYYSRDYAVTWGMMDEGASHKEVMDSIYSRMKDKIYTLRYPNRLLLAILRKNSAAMTDGTFGMTEMLDDRPVRWNVISEIVLETGKGYRIYGAITTGIWMAQLFMAVLCALSDLRRKEIQRSVFYVTCLGSILFLMIWEARSRYLFGFVPVYLMIPSVCEQRNSLFRRTGVAGNKNKDGGGKSG